MSELPPDLMNEEDPPLRAERARVPVDLMREEPEVLNSQAQQSSRIPIVLSSIALLMSLATGGITAVIYENGTRADKAALASIDKRLTDVEMRVAHVSSDVDSRLRNLDELLRDLKSDVLTLNRDLDEYRAQLLAQNERVAGVEGVVVELETFVKSLAVRPEPQKKRTVSAKPSSAPKRAADVELLSVRSIGNIAVVRIGNGADQSPLMQVGDRWRQWEFVGVEGANATFTRNGHSYRLAL